MPNLDKEAPPIPGIVNLDQYKKDHPQRVAQSVADFTQQPVPVTNVLPVKHNLNDHVSGSLFEVVSSKSVEQAEVKIPGTYKTPTIPGADTLNRLITNVGFTKSKKTLEEKAKMLTAKAKALYGKDATIRLVGKKQAA